MQIWIVLTFLFCYGITLFFGGQKALKSLHDGGGKAFQDDDHNDHKPLLQSSVYPPHPQPSDHQSLVQQSISSFNDTRRLLATQVHICYMNVLLRSITDGSLLITVFVLSHLIVWLLWLLQNYIAIYAGTAIQGSSGDGGAATSARLNYPAGMAIDTNGNLYIADRSNHKIRKVSTAGIITTFAGTGTAGSLGDGSAASSALLYNPQGIAIYSGNCYISDTTNNKIRKVNSTGFISTYAGTNTAGSSGDGFAATLALLYNPQGLTIDSNGNLFIADRSNHIIRKITGAGIITTYAGTGGTAGSSGDNGAATSAKLNSPYGVAIDSNGNLYIADTSNYIIRKVSVAGIITAYAGTAGFHGSTGDNGQATSAKLYSPQGVAVDSIGTVYIADTINNKVRMVSSGIITTVAGTGVTGSSGDNGYATSALLYSPVGVTIDISGNDVYVSTQNNEVRFIYEPSSTPTSQPTLQPTLQVHRKHHHVSLHNTVSHSPYVSIYLSSSLHIISLLNNRHDSHRLSRRCNQVHNHPDNRRCVHHLSQVSNRRNSLHHDLRDRHLNLHSNPVYNQVDNRAYVHRLIPPCNQVYNHPINRHNNHHQDQHSRRHNLQDNQQDSLLVNHHNNQHNNLRCNLVDNHLQYLQEGLDHRLNPLVNLPNNLPHSHHCILQVAS